jgi:serine protease Do
LAARRLVLLATVAGLSVATFFGGAKWSQDKLALSTPAFAQNVSKDVPAGPVGFADIVEKVKPAVISVRVKKEEPSDFSGFSDGDSPFGPGSPFERFFRRFGTPDNGMPNRRGRNFIVGQGSGFFISPDGYAVTNNHVVDKADTVEVVTDDGKKHSAKVIGTDPKTDLALIKVDGNGFPYANLADHTPRIGDWVLAVGNPFGLGGTVTAGIVSARGRDIGAGPYDDFIQIDAPVNKGNSGGPTFDVEGNVIGVNTAIFSPSGGSVGIAFAIPAETVKAVVAQLQEHGKVTRGWIGVQIQPVTADIADSLGMKKPEGALVAEAQANSPASKAGVESGDVITSVNNEPIKDARDLAKKIGAIAPGTAVELSLMRKGEQKTVSLKLGELPHERQARADAEDRSESGGRGTEVPRLGLTLSPASGVAGGGNEGVVVTGIDPYGPAADHGFRIGDVIVEVGGKQVSTPSDVRRALADARGGGKRTILMRVKSGDSTRFVAVPLGRG